MLREGMRPKDMNCDLFEAAESTCEYVDTADPERRS